MAYTEVQSDSGRNRAESVSVGHPFVQVDVLGHPRDFLAQCPAIAKKSCTTCYIRRRELCESGSHA